MPRKPDAPCAGGCGHLLWRSSTSGDSPKCRACRKRDYDWPQQSTRTLGLCSMCDRPAQARDMCSTHYAAWHRAENGRKTPKPSERKKCKWCGGVHQLNSDGTTLDAEGLTHAQWVRHHGDPSKSRVIVPAPTDPIKWESRFLPKDIARRSRFAIVEGPCAWCGERFAASTTNLISIPRLCSVRCARQEQRAHRGRFAISDVRRKRIYERDGWACQICREPMSKIYTHSDPWSPTLDHVIPQSSAPVPDNSDANLRSTHALCNSLRGAEQKSDAEVRAIVADWPVSNVVTS